MIEIFIDFPVLGKLKVSGKTLEEAQNISNQEIVDILELPALKIHCSVLAEEAIHRAIDDFKSRRNND